MGRLNDETRHRNESAIRAAMDRLLSGRIPADGRCDIKTLAAEAGVTRTGFYPKKNPDSTVRPGPYQHLADEFERRLKALQAAGEVADPRAAHIERLKSDNATLKRRVAERDEQIEALTAFKDTALSRLAAQHDEMERLRRDSHAGATVRHLSARRRGVLGPQPVNNRIDQP